MRGVAGKRSEGQRGAMSGILKAWQDSELSGTAWLGFKRILQTGE